MIARSTRALQFSGSGHHEIGFIQQKGIEPPSQGDSPNIMWCTGPSKTADVEGILIEGVHGPGEQIALLQ